MIGRTIDSRSKATKRLGVKPCRAEEPAARSAAAKIRLPSILSYAVLHARPARHPPAANRERVGVTGRGAPTTTDRPALVPEPSEVDQSRCGATMAPPSAPPQR